MRACNLLALEQGFKTMPLSLAAAFEAQLCERELRLDGVREHEARSLVALVESLRVHGLTDPAPYEGFVFSFTIPQISSEFDLLRICEATVVNIELKVKDVGVRRIEQQLARNRYYLAPLERTTYTFTYVADTGALYEMGADGTLARVDTARLVRVLATPDVPYTGRVEHLFKASNYLVSPLNDTERFLRGSYFLTNHQMQIKRDLLEAYASKTSTQPPCYLVYGSAGTGKSLLLYDLAKTLGGTCRACVVHCGTLSNGHDKLNQQQGGFVILSAKRVERVDFAPFETILVDEAQLLWPRQLEHLVRVAAGQGKLLYLSVGPRQTAPRRGAGEDVEKTVRSAYSHPSIWKLSQKIRTNRELAAFLRAFFHMSGSPHVVRTHDVKVFCANGIDGAQELVGALRAEGYQFISYTGDAPSATSFDEVVAMDCPSVSAVIDQEFERVVMVVGARFSVPEATYYRQLLYEGLICARDGIALVVLNNERLLRDVLRILDQ